LGEDQSIIVPGMLLWQRSKVKTLQQKKRKELAVGPIDQLERLKRDIVSSTGTGHWYGCGGLSVIHGGKK